MKLSGLVERESDVDDLSNHQVLLEECRKREDVYTGIANLAIHIASLGLHSATAGTTLPLHLPFKNVAFPTMLALLAPGLEILGAEGLNDLVADLNGGWPDMPSIFDGSGPIDGIQNHLSGALSGNSLNLASLVCLCS